MDTLNISDTYFSLLKNLSVKSKLELISKLANSISSREPRPNVNFRENLADFIPEQSAEEIIADLRKERVFNRKIEDFE